MLPLQSGRPLEDRMPRERPKRGRDGHRVRWTVPTPGQLSAERTGDTMADVGQPEGAACGPTPGAVRGLAGGQPRYTRERGRLQDLSDPPDVMTGSNHVRGLRDLDVRAWAMSPAPKAPGQEKSGAVRASVARLPADHRVQSGRWAWSQGNFVSGECPAGGTSQEREKDLRSLHRAATRRVLAGVPAGLRGTGVH